MCVSVDSSKDEAKSYQKTDKVCSHFGSFDLFANYFLIILNTDALLLL